MTVNHTDQSINPRGPRFQVATNIASTSTFTSMTAALHDVLGANAVAHANLQNVRFARVVGLVTTDDDSAAGPELRAQYSVDGGSTWAYFNATAGTGKSVFTGQTHAPGPWNPVPEAARKDHVLVRVVGFGGDAGASPVVNQLGVEFSA